MCERDTVTFFKLSHASALIFLFLLFRNLPYNLGHFMQANNNFTMWTKFISLSIAYIFWYRLITFITLWILFFLNFQKDDLFRHLINVEYYLNRYVVLIFDYNILMNLVRLMLFLVVYFEYTLEEFKRCEFTLYGYTLFFMRWNDMFFLVLKSFITILTSLAQYCFFFSTWLLYLTSLEKPKLYR